MITGRDIVCISSIDWDFIWQGHQEIMTTFAWEGNRVLFIENTGVRRPGLRDLPRLRHRLQAWRQSTKGFRQVQENLFVYAPVILPFPYSRVARWINRRLLIRALERWMRTMGFSRPIVWTFLPTPLARDLLRELRPAATVYYCIDDLASSSRQARRIVHSERQVFREADLVFVTSEQLRQRALKSTNQVYLFPFGVNVETFERARLHPNDLPDELTRLPHPIIGYVGGLHQWLDQDLLSGVIERMPEASFVFIGPVQTDVSRLTHWPNVQVLSARPHAELPRYLLACDVALIPYRLSEYTANVYPTKLNEYLAMGLPVVSTPLPEMERFNARHPGVVRVAQGAEDFAQAVREAAADPKAGPVVERRIDVSRTNSWRTRITQMSRLIEDVLRRRQATNQWELVLRRVYQGARGRTARLLFGALAVYLLCFQSPLIWWVAEPLRVHAPPRAADAIVVFAGGVGESGKAGGGYQERVKRAVDLYRAGYAPRIVFSSGYRFVFQEAEVMRELAVAQGVPASAIVLETSARNTHENVILSAELLRRIGGVRSVLLVSSPYHMRRAVGVWKRLVPGVETIPEPVPESQFYAHSRGASLEQIRGIFHEYLSLLYYWGKGWM